MGAFNGVRTAVARWLAPAPTRLVESGSGAEEPPPNDVPPAGATVRDNDAGWSRLAGRIGQRDLMPMEQTRMQELAAYVWEANPLANRLVELPVAFLLGEGVRLEADAEEAQAWLDAFWNDPLNAMDLKLAEHVRELALFGEQCWPVLGNDLTGTIRLGKIDPSWIVAVITDPENPAVVIGVETRDPVASGHLRRRRVAYAAADAELFSPAGQALRAEMQDGDCFFWRINCLSSGLRGRSDLLPALDHVDAHEQLLFGEVERAAVLRQIIWDVKMTGATPEQVEERARTVRPPEPLSVRVHNEAEEWQVLTPQLNSADATEATRLVRNHALGGATIPEFWMADGGNVNLATASSMGEPTYKVFLQRQRLWRAILEDVAAYVIRCRLAAVGLPQLAGEANRRLYPAGVLREAVPLFEGVRVFVKGDAEHLAGAGKDVRNLIGGLTEAVWNDAEGAIEARLTLITGENDPVAVRIREAMARGVGDLFGLSIDAVGPSRRAADGVLHVSGIARVSSVDLIVEPGAGGQILNLIEAAPGEGDTMDREQLIALIQAANPKLLDGVDTAAATMEQLQAILTAALAPAAPPTVTEAEDAPAMSRDDILAAIRALDAALIPADLSAVTDDELRAILDRAKGSAAATTTTQMVEAALDRAMRMRDQLDRCALPAESRARIAAEMRSTRFTEASLTRRIQSEGAYLASLGVGRIAGNGLGAGRWQVGEGQGEKHMRMLEAFFDPNHKDHKDARSFKQCYIDITGDRLVTGQIMQATRLSEALSSTSWAEVLGNSITRRMIAEYRGATDLDMWKLLTGTPVPVGDFRTQERARWGGYGDLPTVAEAAAYAALTSPTDENSTYAVQKRGGTETVTLEMIKNDDVGAIQRLPGKLARAAKRTLCKFVLDFIRSNPTIYDTVALFHATHNNLGTGALAGPTYAAARLAMVKQTEYGSTDAIGVGPKYLWVPPDLEETAANLFRRNTNLDATFVQSLTPTIVPVWYWTDANDWAATADPADIPFIEIGFLDGEEEPAILVQDLPNVGSLFTNDQITYKIRHIYGGSVLDFRGAYKAVVP